MSTLDDLFREKLTDYSIQPSAGTWQKVEAGLSKKNRGIIWVRIAAVLALVCLLATAIRVSWKNGPAPLARTTQSPDKKVAEAIKPAPAPSITDKQNVASVDRTVEKKSPLVKEVKAESKSEAPVLVQPEEIETPSLVAKATPESAVVQSSKPIVLVYTLGPVENPAATSAQAERDGSLKKVVEFARTVKHSDASPVGELRTMKEDLFALDFKKKTTGKKQ